MITFFDHSIYRKSKEEHTSYLAKMDKEKREMEEAIANSLVDQKRLEAERDKQRVEIANHFKLKSAEHSGRTLMIESLFNDLRNTYFHFVKFENVLTIFVW